MTTTEADSGAPYPWEAISTARDHCPVGFVEQMGAIRVMSAAAIREITTAPTVFASRFHTVRMRDEELPTEAQVLPYSDPPRHSRSRRLLVAAFNASRVEQARPRAREIANDAVDALARSDGTFELVDRIARPVPQLVLAEILGVPARDRVEFARCAQLAEAAARYTNFDDIPWRDDLLRWDQYLRELVADRRVHVNDDDLIAGMCKAEHEGQRFSDNEVAAMVKVLVQAGNTTTTALITNTVVALDEHPSAKKAFVADPACWVERVVEEGLRYDGPLQGLYRTATEESAVGGCPVHGGQKVFLWFTAANHDPEAFESPDAFLPQRWSDDEPNKHLAFGYGPHFCIGSNLARVEAQETLCALYSRLPGLRVREGFVPEQLPGNIFRAWRQVKMTWTGSIGPRTDT